MIPPSARSSMGHPMSAARSEMGLCEYAATCLRAVRRDFCSEGRDPTDRDFSAISLLNS